MTIQEVIESGKRFRRARENFWSYIYNGAIFYKLARSESVRSLGIKDLVATDWEVEEVTVSITRQDLHRAYDTAIAEHRIREYYTRCDIDLLINAIANTLIRGEKK